MRLHLISPPVGKLTFPDGHQEAVTLDKGNTDQNGNICWSYSVRWVNGIQLGMYTLSIENPEGKLTHSWGIDYPYCRSEIELDSSTQHREDFLIGFPPNLELTFHFYASTGRMQASGRGGIADYVATRKLVTSSDGTVILDMTITRSAPFNARDLFYVTVNSHEELLYYDEIGYESTAVDYTLFHPPTLLRSKYSTYKTWELNECPNGPFATPSSDTIYNMGQVTPQNGNSLALFSKFDDTKQQAGQLEPGLPVIVLEKRVALENEHVEIWYHIQTEDDRDGWVFGNNLVGIYPTYVTGSQATLSGTIASVLLHERPDKNSPIIATLFTGVHVVIISDTVVSDTVKGIGSWEYIKSDTGQKGWVTRDQLSALPWLPMAVSDQDTVIVGPTPIIMPSTSVSATPSHQASLCPDFAPSRLAIGMKARVLRSTNDTDTTKSIRESPGSNETKGEVPFGEIITIVDGPVCTKLAGHLGIAWWKINYNGILGWTSEGKGTVYYLEPAQ